MEIPIKIADLGVFSHIFWFNTPDLLSYPRQVHLDHELRRVHLDLELTTS